MVAVPIDVGNVLSPVSGTIVVIDDTAEEAAELRRRSGPRFPRPHLQRLDTDTGRYEKTRLAEGTLPPPPMPTGEIDFEEAITEVNTPAPRTPTARPRPTTVS